MPLEPCEEGHGFGSFGRGGQDRLLVGLEDAQPIVEILGVIGAGRVGDAEIGAEDRGAEFRD